MIRWPPHPLAGGVVTYGSLVSCTAPTEVTDIVAGLSVGRSPMYGATASAAQGD